MKARKPAKMGHQKGVYGPTEGRRRVLVLRFDRSPRGGVRARKRFEWRD